MGLPANVFSNVTGTPATPTFAELIYVGHSVESNGSSQAILNIIHFARISGPGTDTEADLVTAVKAELDTVLSNALSVGYVPDEVTCRFMDDPTRAKAVFTNDIIAAVTGDRHPSFVAAVTRKITYGRGRSYRGSTHWAPIAESQTTLDQLNAGAITLWDLVVTGLQNLSAPFVAVADTWQMIVLSPTLSNLTVNPSLFSGAVCNEALLNHVVGTMRRRKQGVGT